MGSSSPSTTTSIQATVGSASTTFNELTFDNDGAVASISNFNQDGGSIKGVFILSWTNNATNADYLLIQRSIDNISWVTVATLNDPTTTACNIAVEDPRQSYYFGVVPVKH